MIYTLHIHKSDYTNYSLISETNRIDLNNVSLVHGLFHLDIVDQNNEKIVLVKRNPPKIPPIGILELYSKYQYKANSKGVPMYVFVPINNCYPKALVASTLKKKYTENIFVTINYVSWEKDNIFLCQPI